MEQETHQEEVALEAETRDDATEEKETDKKRSDVLFELVLVFVLGFLLGVTIKTEAAKRVTIGFNDYKVIQQKQAYDFDLIKAEAEAEQKAAQEEQNSQEQQNPGNQEAQQ